MSNKSGSTEQKLSDLSPEKAELLKRLRERRSRQARQIRPYSRESSGELTLPTSSAQQRLWFIDQLERGSAAYHITNALRLRGVLHLDSLRAALDAIVERHEVLRTVFVVVGGEPMQRIVPSGRFALRSVDMREYPRAQREEHVQRHKVEEANEPFDLRAGPMVRGRLLVLQEQEHVLLLTMHHIVSDGWSIGVLIDELAELYRACSQRRPAHLPALPIQYADYARWQRQWLRGPELEKQLAYWREQLRDAATSLDLPADQPPRTAPSYAGDTVSFVVDAELSGRLRALAQRHEMTLFMALYAAWAILLSRLGAQEDVLIGTPVANRQRSEVERLIGFFVNTLVLRVGVRAQLTLDEFLATIKRTTLEAYDNQDIPFERIVKELQPQRSLNHSPLFQVMLVLRNTPRDQLRLPDLAVSVEDDGYRSAMFDLLLVMEERDSELAGLLSYATDVFDRATVEGWMECFVVLLRELTCADGTLSDLPILSEQQQWQVTKGFNATCVPYPSDKLVHELFEEQVLRTPEAVAVALDDQQLTYAQLNGRADQLAHYLSSKRVGTGRLVGICLERGLDMVVALLATLKAGGGYLPLDPSYPAERLQYMLADAAPQVVLTNSAMRPLLPATQAELVLLDMLWAALDSDLQQSAPRDRSARVPGQLVYVIYTSGSTGRPKGTAMSHRAMVNLIEWHRRSLVGSQGCRVLQFAALSFDVAFQEIFTTLCTGGALVLLHESVRKDPRALLEWIARYGVARLFLPPLMLQSLAACCTDGDDLHPASLRDVITAGEQLRITPEIRAFFGRLPQCRLHNHYGPTETHVVTALTLGPSVAAWPVLPAIGAPIANSQIYVLDEQRRPVPMGARGEIYIGGAGVAQGYLGRAELTAARFLPDPYDADSTARLYRTGDVGRWRTDGTLEYLGRNDDQVKIRGYRIELGEVEAQLAKHPDVREAAVVAREDVPGEKRLVAYLTLHQHAQPAHNELRAYVKAALPEHMTPSAFVVLQALPLTPSGKLARRALPAPDLGSYATHQYEAAQGAVEELLVSAWEEVLGVHPIGRRDNFFELGGHSLLIVQMMERMRRAGLRADVRSVYESATLQDLARKVVAAEPEDAAASSLITPTCDMITPEMLTLVEMEPRPLANLVQRVPGGARNIQDIYPLTSLQEGMLFHHLFSADGLDAYARALLLSFPTQEKMRGFVDAVQEVIQRHDILRTAVFWEGLPQAVQVVQRHAQLSVESVQPAPGCDPLEALNERMQSPQYRLDLRRAPLLRLHVARGSEGERCGVLLQTHHLVFDNQSLHTMLEEIIAHLRGRAHELPSPAPYRNHVAHALEYARAKGTEAFFRAKLADVDEPTAPFGLLDVRGDAGRIERAGQALEPSLAGRLRAQARRLAVSPATLFHAIWALVVAHTAGRDDVVFGTVLLGRSQAVASVKRTIGLFINTLPVRLRLGDLTATELVQHTHRELLELLHHEQASLAVAQRCSNVHPSTPLFSALLNYWHSGADLDSDLADAAGITVEGGQGGTSYPLMLSVADRQSTFETGIKCDRRIDAQRMLDCVGTAVRSLLEALESAPQTPALALSVLSHAERRLLLETFNATSAGYPRHKLVHQLFEEQVRRVPQAPALICSGRKLTYRDLNEHANRLAHYLRARGIGRGARVALYMERSEQMVIGMLSTLKTGAAYMPLDSSCPPERLAFLLEDAAVAAVLTQKSVTGGLPLKQVPVLCVDDERDEIAAQPADDLAAVDLTTEDLAYVIYTSGSTGQPKGVMVSHRNVVNYASHAVRQFDVAAAASSLLGTSMSFDLCLTALYPPLICGSAVTLCAEGEDLSRVIMAGSGYSPVKLTPTHLGLLSLPAERIDGRVSALVVGGEPLRGEALQWWRRHSPGTRLFNHYGPTETTIGCVVNEITAGVAGLVPIGRPIANTRIYILDRRMGLAPLGVVGEIYVAGDGVARGYWNRPELTAQRFLRDPFCADPHARMYRTGDLGRWRTDGTVEYLGRNDQQVKFRGFRVELGEIEARLLEHTGVKEAVVMLREDVVGDQRLVAYVTHGPGTATSAQELRSHLAALLPQYMVPGAFMALSSMPLTPNGKLDRRALPPPEDHAHPTRPYEPPSGETEQVLAQMWQGLLKVQRVSRADDFFELGGHSLHAIRLVAAITQRFATTLPLAALFRCPTIRELAQLLQPISRETVATEGASAGDFEEGVIGPEDGPIAWLGAAGLADGGAEVAREQ